MEHVRRKGEEPDFEISDQECEQMRLAHVVHFGGEWPAVGLASISELVAAWERLVGYARRPEGATLKRFDYVTEFYFGRLEKRLLEAGIQRPASERAEILARCIRPA